MVLIEICVDTVEKLSAAQAGGADRIELCARLDQGGLTPDDDLLEDALARAQVPVHVMVRPRPGGFEYTPAEFVRMLREVDELRGREEVAGLVFGVLHRGHTLHTEHVRELVLAARPKSVTFHRAFDQVPNRMQALEELVELGTDRVLTSGGAADAWTGREELKKLVERAAGRIVVMPGGGVRVQNAQALAAHTGARELHSSTPFRWRELAGRAG